MKKVIMTVPDLGQNIDLEKNRLLEAGFSFAWIPLDGTDDVQAIIQSAVGGNFIIAASELWNKEAIEAVKNTVEMITRFGAGYDKVDIQVATEQGIAVANTPGANAEAVAVHALTLMLSLSRQVVRYDREIKQGIWKPVLVHDIRGKTIGFLGFGAIGRELAKLLQGFSCEMIAFDPVKNEEAARRLNVKYVKVDELVRTSDYISIHMPLTDKTQGFINRDFLDKMKASAYLINTSRGKIIKENDLIEAVRNGIIAGAGLDVFVEQPLPENHPLKFLDNVVLTPYCAPMSDDGFSAMLHQCVDNILCFDSGQKVKYLINPDYINHKKRVSSEVQDP